MKGQKADTIVAQIPGFPALTQGSEGQQRLWRLYDIWFVYTSIQPEHCTPRGSYFSHRLSPGFKQTSDILPVALQLALFSQSHNS